MADVSAADPPAGERYALAANNELRLEVPPGRAATIRLASGSAEVFGAEMAPGRPYSVGGTNAAVFTWHGCEVDVDADDGGGGLDVVYVSDETGPNVACVNTHAQLEAMRDERDHADGKRLDRVNELRELYEPMDESVRSLRESYMSLECLNLLTQVT